MSRGLDVDADVLVVDDSPDLCRMLVIYFKSQGLRGVGKCDGEEALTWLATHRPSVVVLDVTMPGISGIDVLGRIRADHNFEHLPVLLHSALNEPELQRLSNLYGADGFIPKGQCDLRAMLDRIVALSARAKSN